MAQPGALLEDDRLALTSPESLVEEPPMVLKQMPCLTGLRTDAQAKFGYAQLIGNRSQTKTPKEWEERQERRQPHRVC